MPAQAQNISRPLPTAATAWIPGDQDPGYAACQRLLYNLCRAYAIKFKKEALTVEAGFELKVADMASEAYVHILLKAKCGTFDRVPDAQRWFYIRRAIQNKIIDVYRKHHRQKEVRIPAWNDIDGKPLSEDTVMDLHSGADGVVSTRWETFSTQYNWDVVVPLREIRLLEAILDHALTGFPEERLIKLRFGLYRDDVMGSGRKTHMDPCSDADLVALDYGQDRFAVRRRVKQALKKLRALIEADLERRGVINLNT